MKTLTTGIYMSIRNIWRSNKSILIMTIGMLTVVFVNLVFMPALLDGMVDNLNNRLVDITFSDVIVEPEGEKLITNSEQLSEDIAAINGVRKVARKANLYAEIEHEGNVAQVETHAIDVNTAREVFDIDKYLMEGEMLSKGDKGKVVLGVQVAGNNDDELEMYEESLKHAVIGEKVTISFNNGTSKEFEVMGIYDSSSVQTDVLAFIPLDDYEEVFPMSTDAVSSIHVNIENDAEPEKVIAAISAIDANQEISAASWKDKTAFLESITDSFGMVVNILKAISFIVAAVTIFIVTYIDLTNNRKQIGIQRAIGIKPRAIMINYIIRSLFYGLVGIFTGVIVFNYLITPLVDKYPFEFPIAPGTLLFDIGSLSRSIIQLLIVILIAATIPTIRSLRIKILDAIWG